MEPRFPKNLTRKKRLILRKSGASRKLCRENTWQKLFRRGWKRFLKNLTVSLKKSDAPECFPPALYLPEAARNFPGLLSWPKKNCACRLLWVIRAEYRQLLTV